MTSPIIRGDILTLDRKGLSSNVRRIYGKALHTVADEPKGAIPSKRRSMDQFCLPVLAPLIWAELDFLLHLFGVGIVALVGGLDKTVTGSMPTNCC